MPEERPEVLGRRRDVVEVVGRVRDQFDFLQRIHVKEARGRHERRMGPDETETEKEWPFGSRAEQFDRSVCSCTIRLTRRVSSLDPLHLEAVTQVGVGIASKPDTLVLIPRRAYRDIPGRRVLMSHRSDTSWNAHVKHLADTHRAPAVVLEHLRQRDCIRVRLAEIDICVCHDPGRVRAQAGHQRSTAGSAERELAVCIVEAHAAGG